jgi:hypothetical protein
VLSNFLIPCIRDGLLEFREKHTDDKNEKAEKAENKDEQNEKNEKNEKNETAEQKSKNWQNESKEEVAEENLRRAKLLDQYVADWFESPELRAKLAETLPGLTMEWVTTGPTASRRKPGLSWIKR